MPTLSHQRRGPSSRLRPSGSNLSMHFGHSHSHHHHHTHQAVEAKSWKEQLVRFIPKRRESGRIAFAALVTLCPALIVRHRWIRMDWIAFFITSSVLTLSDTARRQSIQIIRKFQALKSDFEKHSPRGQGGRRDAADQVTLLSVAVNLALSIGKFVIGVMSRSSALVADAAHSLSDLVSDGITLWAVQLGRLPPDEDHPYGHGKFEAIGSLFLALTLLGTGVGVGLASYRALLAIIFKTGSDVLIEPPSPPALVMAAISIISKEWLYRITKNVGERMNSQVLIANAWHHRSDAYSSVLALASIVLARMGWLAADAAAGLLVGGMIGLTGFEILGESIKQLTDTNESQLADKVTNLIETDSDVGDINSIRARQLGSSAWVDVDVTTRAEGLSASALRNVEERLRWKIMTSLEGVQAKVHATEYTNGKANGFSAPLLSHDHDHDHNDHDHDHHHDHAAPANGEEQRYLTVQQVQNEVKKQLPFVNTPSVVVKYDDQNTVHVDVVVQLSAYDATTITDAKVRAETWKADLERSPLIDKAKMFLDLSEESGVTSESDIAVSIESIDTPLGSLG